MSVIAEAGPAAPSAAGPAPVGRTRPGAIVAVFVAAIVAVVVLAVVDLTLGTSAVGGFNCPRGRFTLVPLTTTVEARPL